MPLDASKRVCDLSQLQNDDKHDSTFYSMYHLKRANVVEEDHNINHNDMSRFEFRKNLDIDHLKTFPKIVFLGTVSAKASPTRNNTSILLHTT